MTILTISDALAMLSKVSLFEMERFAGFDYLSSLRCNCFAYHMDTLLPFLHNFCSFIFHLFRLLAISTLDCNGFLFISLSLNSFIALEIETEATTDCVCFNWPGTLYS